MARICLVRPLLSSTDFNGYPLNLLILAAGLRRNGHDVYVKDYDYLKEVESSWAADDFAKRAAEDILFGNPGYVGITALCSNYVLALDLATELKEASRKVHVTFGGPHVSLCAAETLTGYDCLDTAVIGEGEVTYPELIDALENEQDLSAVEGIAFRREGKPYLTAPRPLLANLDDSPRPAYDLVDVPSYIKAAKSTYLEVYAGSGCPFQCTFCSTSIVWERKYRTMSASRIVDEIERLNGDYGARCFNLIHDNLSTDKLFLAEIADLIRLRRLKVAWGFSSRIDTLDESTVQNVATAGCDYVFFGVESGSGKIQSTMKKRLKVDQIYNTLDICIRNGIRPVTSFILGFPDETPDDVTQTICLAFECKAAGVRRSFINLLSPYTGTPVMRANIGRLFFSPQNLNSTMVAFLAPRHLKVIAANPFIFSNYYSLEYDADGLTAADYQGLVDFYTICLFKYPYTMSFVLNDRLINPITLYRLFQSRVEALSYRDRDKLALDINAQDLVQIIGVEKVDAISSLIGLDDSIRLAALTNPEGVIYSGMVNLSTRTARIGSNSVAVEESTRYYIHFNTEGGVKSQEISQEHSLLYESLGLPSVHSIPPGITLTKN